MANALRLLHRIEPIIALALLGAALWVLHHELALHSWEEISADITGVAPYALVTAVALTVLNYIVLTGYDALALSYAGVKQPYRHVAAGSTLGFALSQALGFPLLTGAPLRVRLYGAWGVSGADLTRMIAFSSMTFWVGVLAVGGALLSLTTPIGTAVPPGSARLMGILLLVVFTVYALWSARGAPTLRVAAIELTPPKVRQVLAQVGLTTADWTIAASVLYVLLPDGTSIPFPAFVAAFITAQVLGFVSHVPGGLGVFEATIVTLMPASIPTDSLFASLVVYRVVYYLLPLTAAGLVLAAIELSTRRHHAVRALSAARSVLPTVLAAGVFALGATMLLVGAVPIPTGRVAWLASWIPPVALNLSHFMASLCGAGLIVVARGIQRRLRGAYQVTLVALSAVVVLALTTFAAPALSVVSGLAALALWASRDSFYRQSSLRDEAFTPRWVAAIAMTVCAAVWLGFFSNRGIDYTGDLWWRLTFDADAPRFLRASVGAASILLLFSIARLLRATPHSMAPADREELDAIAPLVFESPNPAANLALLGDKSILRSASGRSFLMYAVRGSSWIALGDPTGDETEFRDLMWQFRDQADRAGDSAVFYKVPPHSLFRYVDMGMSLFKLGEEGRVSLAGLEFEGKKWADLRKALRKLEKLGAEFVILSPDEVVANLPALRAISDDWLATKNAKEKGFSLGYFDESYLARNSVAVISLGGSLVAFASLWLGGSREELSVDLMRHASDAPNGSMDFLFANLLMWGREQGYRYFALGMAPLAGLESHRLAPAWHRLGDALFDHGERFYNFRGLYDYKEKFDPEWEARYLAIGNHRLLPKALSDVTSLVGGGLKGALSK